VKMCFQLYYHSFKIACEGNRLKSLIPGPSENRLCGRPGNKEY
jgi:hypothetical protein